MVVDKIAFPRQGDRVAGQALTPALPRRRLPHAVAVLLLALHAGGAGAVEQLAAAKTVDLTRLSIEELADIEITSVSKHAELLSDAAAAIFVITNDDIRRAGVTSLPEALRLAPNVQVARIDAHDYAISVRGFNSINANKLLVLIDGRSVYTPLFGGVFWDVQDVLLEDIDRIEVISGPGGTLWGANAVNGVINILTRSAKDTVGGLVSVGAGTQERSGGARYGARLGEDAAFRLYAKGFEREDTATATGVSKQDDWRKTQAGFRMDWSRGGDALTLQGDVYDGALDQPVLAHRTIAGGNLLGRWNRTLADGAALQLQAYYDRTRRVVPGGFGDVIDVYDIDVQHRFGLGEHHDLLWGGGYRLSRDQVDNIGKAFSFLPAQRDLSLANVFLQDSIALSERLKLTLGAKLEHNNFSGLEFQPNARLAWKLDERTLLWSAISRAVHTPTRRERDLFTPGPPLNPFKITGGSDFAAEQLTAYEIGYRAQPSARASFSISAFYNVYDQLRSLEPVGDGSFRFGNQMEGHTVGVEAWGSYQVNDSWRLSAGYNALRQRLRFKSGSGDPGDVRTAQGNDPAHQFLLRSSLNLPHGLEFDATVRRVGALPNPAIPAYTALDARLGWHVSKQVELSLTGVNLLDRRHPEVVQPALVSSKLPQASELERGVYLKLTWKN